MGKWDEMRRATPRRKETEGGQIFIPASQGFHVPGDGDLGEGGYIPREVTVKTPVTKDPSFVVLKRTPAPAAPAPAEVEPMTILRRTPALAEEEPDLFDEWLRKLDAEAAEVAKKKAAVEAAKKAAEEEAARKKAEEEAAKKAAEEEAKKKAEAAAKKKAEAEAKKKAEEAAKKKAEEEAKKKAEEEAAKKKAEEEAKKKAEEEAKVIFPRLGYTFTTEEGDLLVFLDIEKAKKFSKENGWVLPYIHPVLVNKKTGQVLKILSNEEIFAMFDE